MTSIRADSHMTFAGNCSALPSGIGAILGEHQPLWSPRMMLKPVQREGWHSRSHTRLHRVRKLLAAVPLRELLIQQWRSGERSIHVQDLGPGQYLEFYLLLFTQRSHVARLSKPYLHPRLPQERLTVMVMELTFSRTTGAPGGH
jgi:hypothetical protein